MSSLHAPVVRIERLFEMLRRFREERAPVDDERTYFKRACRIAVEHGDFRFAWIGLVDRARECVVPADHAGLAVEYLDGLEIPISDSPSGRGPTGVAVREGRSVVCSDVVTDAAVAGWRPRYLSFGFRSSGAFPIRRGGVVYGTLNLYADTPGFIEALERAMMEELATRLGMALDEIDREAARRTMEARLVESEARYRSIVERAADGVILFGADRRVLDANPTACVMFGYTHEELLRLTVDDLIAPEKRETYRAEIARYHETSPGTAVSYERVCVTKEGRRVDVEIHSKRLAQGASLAIVRDITQRKRSDAERAATERLVSLGRLAQSVGHEINNPLAYLTLRLEHARSLARTLPSEKRGALDETLAFAADGAARIAHVVRSLSAFGRGDTDVVEAVAIGSVVVAALSLVSNRLQHLATVQLELADTPLVFANAFGLTQVLVNLLLNAADAMESVGSAAHAVTISSRLDSEHVVLEVLDTGPGIPEADLPRLFDVGFTTKPVGKGSGVGLAVSRSIITSLGGTLDAGNRLGGGAVCRITLSATESAPSARPTPAPRGAVTRRRILVVDDEPTLVRTIALLLSDHDVVVSTTVAEALELCVRDDFDFVFCDLMMPNGGGMGLYERLGRERPQVRDRMVFITGGTFTESATRFLERIPNRRLFKPFPPEALLALVEGPATPEP